MPTATSVTSPNQIFVQDAIELPADPNTVVEGRASQRDAYPIFVTRSLGETLARLGELIGTARVAVISDRTVMRLHGNGFISKLRGAEELSVYAIPPGESNKTLETAARLWDWLAAGSLGRRDIILTLGGGVINDLGGWVASGYMRGVPYINVPTTLIGQVDGAIGGKLAVNHGVAKNLIGGFRQPRGVVSNIGFLQTLDTRHLRAGIAETIKKAIIASPAYWDFIENHIDDLLAKDPEALRRLVAYASAIKTALIERDPYEHDSRRTLGFGHAVAHALETVTGYGPVLHGEAVSFGMTIEARIALERGLLPNHDFESIVTLLQRTGLPTSSAELAAEPDGTAVLEAMRKIKLIRGGGLRLVLPLTLGETVIADDVTDTEISSAFHAAGLTTTRV